MQNSVYEIQISLVFNINKYKNGMKWYNSFGGIQTAFILALKQSKRKLYIANWTSWAWTSEAIRNKWSHT